MKQWARDFQEYKSDKEFSIKFFDSKYIPSGLMAKINEDITDDVYSDFAIKHKLYG